jgi:hypothetical protein
MLIKKFHFLILLFVSNILVVHAGQNGGDHQPNDKANDILLRSYANNYIKILNKGRIKYNKFAQNTKPRLAKLSKKSPLYQLHQKQNFPKLKQLQYEDATYILKSGPYKITYTFLDILRNRIYINKNIFSLIKNEDFNQFSQRLRKFTLKLSAKGKKNFSYLSIFIDSAMAVNNTPDFEQDMLILNAAGVVNVQIKEHAWTWATLESSTAHMTNLLKQLKVDINKEIDSCKQGIESLKEREVRKLAEKTKKVIDYVRRYTSSKEVNMPERKIVNLFLKQYANPNSRREVANEENFIGYNSCNDFIENLYRTRGANVALGSLKNNIESMGAEAKICEDVSELANCYENLQNTNTANLKRGAKNYNHAYDFTTIDIDRDSSVSPR